MIRPVEKSMVVGRYSILKGGGHPAILLYLKGCFCVVQSKGASVYFYVPATVLRGTLRRV